MAQIKKITAREILDSRGIPTIEGKLVTANNIKVYSQVPSGESLGKHEGIELRDNDKTRHLGQGVLKAVSYINDSIGPKLVGVDTSRLEDIDNWLLKADGSSTYQNLGVNTLMIVSQLILRAEAVDQDMALYQYINHLYNTKFKENVHLAQIPTAIYNMINGGKHGTKNLDFQEFHVVTSTSTKFSKSLEFAVATYNGLKNLFYERNADVSVSEEGGFTPNLFTNTEAFEIIKEVLLSKKVKLGVDVFTGLDCAPSYYFKDNKYAIKDRGASLNDDEYIDFITEAIDKYNILILEDPLQEDDFNNWAKLTKQVGKQVFVVADDFVAGNKERLKKAVAKGACNAVLIKFNQVGTITEMLDLIHDIKKAGLRLIVSHRLGETTDALIADLAVGVQADFVKFGSPARGERIIKYNRLLNIEYKLGISSPYKS
ncbi:phosphopyruvate hydratase [Candidatus Roizmanbacteria bacterium RIFCSPLOWO2_02_FULL_37_19]|uniref:Enolase n=1 Tax=Candidatus Roizmanbacteria bacterium RIFCSPHIGHO2_02_FULL_37_24 TaxID=1802037 RepID=A0A1F7GX16_9BACT|nr:MAG: phosphopyruvate hydratase [Candidatus Roizmanbacteria bacterium RIFCSPHIGHO2_01_FULL_38_41]OGK23076.1 MAG: phosphopyruvate hydratase [Candidatus Roizmanbacteria bacterium RIFCSPHIGHO2_02_FULL_37_24]OGK33363.1 MAG: phosphopyruvate hydratase [Candidatus Roizmanbacteria bacterium RIFCSPHIGHO2_12_FULL_37_23]OGK43657.1 MAG: phosphopyruvate hydratase [Candidatus Roizmanbacteria bacterium RIFCSPLOWO2_01_FULL_37_57]OGK54688.1 MAG: phosphopyruvate hydratase [Candidatus Roizmanbacteria bacterium 